MRTLLARGLPRHLPISGRSAANHVLRQKRAKQNEKARARNRAVASCEPHGGRVLTVAKAGAGEAALPVVMAQLDGSAAKGTIPKSARLARSRLAKALAARK